MNSDNEFHDNPYSGKECSNTLQENYRLKLVLEQAHIDLEKLTRLFDKVEHDLLRLF